MQQTTECLETEGKMKTTTISGSERKMSRFVCFFSRYYLFKPLPFSHLMRSMFVYLVCVCGFKSNVREKHLPFSSSIDCWHTKNDVALTFWTAQQARKLFKRGSNAITSKISLSFFLSPVARRIIIDTRNIFFCADSIRIQTFYAAELNKIVNTAFQRRKFSTREWEKKSFFFHSSKTDAMNLIVNAIKYQWKKKCSEKCWIRKTERLKIFWRWHMTKTVETTVKRIGYLLARQMALCSTCFLLSTFFSSL